MSKTQNLIVIPVTFETEHQSEAAGSCNAKRWWVKPQLRFFFDFW